LNSREIAAQGTGGTKAIKTGIERAEKELEDKGYRLGTG
jgi:hypothetical protein